MLTLADFCEDTGLSTGTLKTLQSVIQRFAVSHSNFSHSIFPPSEYAQGVLDKGTATHLIWIVYYIIEGQQGFVKWFFRDF